MRTVFAMILSLIVSSSIAQNNFGEIKGKVTDSIANNEPLFSATVWVESKGSKIGTVTDINGNYTIKPLPSGTYDVFISFSGYGKKKIEGVVVKTDQITFAQDVALVEGIVGGEHKVVVYKEKLIDPEQTGRYTIGAKTIKNLPIRTDVNKIASLTPGVSVSQDGSEIYFRGSRNGDVIYLVDGVKTIGGKPLVPSQGIGNMAVYTGGVPAKYGDTMGGVIVIETKSYFDVYYERNR